MRGGRVVCVLLALVASTAAQTKTTSIKSTAAYDGTQSRTFLQRGPVASNQAIRFVCLAGYIEAQFPPTVKTAAGWKIFNTLSDALRLGDSATATGFVPIVSFNYPASVGTITAAQIQLTISKVTGVNPLTGKFDGLKTPTTIKIGYVRVERRCTEGFQGWRATLLPLCGGYFWLLSLMVRADAVLRRGPWVSAADSCSHAFSCTVHMNEAGASVLSGAAFR